MPTLHQPVLRGQVVTHETCCPHSRGTRRKGTFRCRICFPPEPPRWTCEPPFYGFLAEREWDKFVEAHT